MTLFVLDKNNRPLQQKITGQEQYYKQQNLLNLPGRFYESLSVSAVDEP